jgi:pyrroloquinoline quinone (PQQ) biosynthesis protein C
MATALAPKIAKNVATHLGDIKALSFFKEHGDLDVDHMREQQEVLTKADLTEADLADIARTILETAHMKRFMLDKLVESVKG